MSYLRTFIALIRRDLRAFAKGIWGRIIDNIILFSTSILLFAYFMPRLGLAPNFAVMIFASCFVIFSFFDCIGFAGLTVMDIEGDRTIVHSIGAPMPSSLTLAQIAVSWALRMGLITLLGIVTGKLLLWDMLDLTHISWSRFVLAYASIYLMWGFFSLWLASLVRRLSNIGTIYVRVANPLFMFGAYMFPWVTAYKVAPWIGYLLLINPMVYANEAMRSSVIGAEGFLPFALSIGALWGFTLFFALTSVHVLKNRLDLPR